MSNLKKLKQKTYDILKKHPPSRNDDGVLVAYYIKYNHQSLITLDINREHRSIKLKDFIHMDSIEDIINARKTIQNEDGMLFPTDDKILKKRNKKEIGIAEKVRETNLPYRDA